MSPRITIFLTTVLLPASLSAQILYDTVAVRPVGPGVKHYRIVAPAVPWNLNVLVADLKNPYISLETVKANDRLAGHEIVRSMAARKSSPGHDAIGATNGDFYSGNGSPTNIQVAQGEIIRGPVNRPAIGFAETNSPMIGVVSFAGSVIGLLLIAAGRGNLKYALPFGTFLAMGAALAVVVGPGVIDWYVNLW